MARHKYVWTIGLFVLIVGFIDDNSYYNYFLLKKDNAELDKEIKKYEDKFNHDYAKLRQLKTDPHEGTKQTTVVRVQHRWSTARCRDNRPAFFRRNSRCPVSLPARCIDVFIHASLAEV